MTDKLEPGSNIENLRILSLDGGGIRGIAVSRILQEIEDYFKQPIHELFDLVVGTSTGGLLSMMLTVPNKSGEILTAEAAKELYLAKGKNIFKSSIERQLEFWGVKYSSDGLKDIICDLFDENTTLKDARTHVGVVCTDEIHSKSVVLNSFRAVKHPGDYRHNAKLCEIARATTAAPTYFDHVTIEEVAKEFIEPVEDDTHEWLVIDDETKKDALNESVEWYTLEKPAYRRKQILLEDGGTSNNNPSYLALKLIKHVLRARNIKAKNIQLVSIGTGTMSGAEEDPEENQAFWKGVGSNLYGIVERILIHDPFRCAIKAYQVHQKIMSHFREKKQSENYIRVQFKITDHQWNYMDDVSTQNMNNLVESAEKYLYSDSKEKTHSEAFKKLISVIEATNPIRAKTNIQQTIKVDLANNFTKKKSVSVKVKTTEIEDGSQNQSGEDSDDNINQKETISTSVSTFKKITSPLKALITTPINMMLSARR